MEWISTKEQLLLIYKIVHNRRLSIIQQLQEEQPKVIKAIRKWKQLVKLKSNITKKPHSFQKTIIR